MVTAVLVVGTVYTLCRIALGQGLCAKITQWYRGKVGSGYLRAHGDYDDDCSQGADETGPKGKVRSGCMTLRQHARTVCRQRSAVRESSADRKLRVASSRARSECVRFWKHDVRERRRHGGLMLGQKVCVSHASASSDGKPEVPLLPPPPVGDVLQSIPIQVIQILPTVPMAHCAGDGNCMWRAVAKSPVMQNSRRSWKNIKKGVLKFGKLNYPERLADWRMLGKWGMPAGALALQL
eukprot:3833569-Amphidinium_carterae.1